MDEALFRSLLKDSYTFQPTPSDWDTGRTGTVLLARTQDGTDVVIKWTDSDNPDYERDKKRIQTEAKILNLLNENQDGSWRVPKVHNSNEVKADDGTYHTTYLAMSLAPNLRVEKELHLLGDEERREIACQFLDVMSTAHSLDISNRDIDIKHLFWDAQLQSLTVIDWGNGRLPGETVPKDSTSDVYYTIGLLKRLIPIKELPPENSILRDLYEWHDKINVLSLTVSDTSPHNMQALKDAFCSESGTSTPIDSQKGQDQAQSSRINISKIQTLILGIIILIVVVVTNIASWNHWGMAGTPQPGVTSSTPTSPALLQPDETDTPTPSIPEPDVTAQVVIVSPTATHPTLEPLPEKAQAGFRTLFDLYKQTQFTQIPLLGPGGTPLPTKTRNGLVRANCGQASCSWSFANLPLAGITPSPQDELRATLDEYYHPQGVLSTVRRISLMGQFSNLQKDQLGEIGLFFGDASQRVELVFRFDAEKKLGMAYKINGQATPITTSTDSETLEQTKFELLTDRPFWLYIQFSGSQVQVFLKEDTIDLLENLPLENLLKIAEFSLPQPIQSVQEIGFIGRGGPIAVLDVLHFKLYTLNPTLLPGVNP